MKKIFFVFSLIFTIVSACTHHSSIQKNMELFTIPFEKNENQTLTYHETIDCYKKMATAYSDVFKLVEMGSTDSGFPLHTAIFSVSGIFEPEKIRKAGKQILLINNGIHPGEPEGIDATVLLLRSYLKDVNLRKLLENTVIVFIPIYNIDGCLNRNSFTRANQDGPESYGFRGNARNFDLNRDFVKCDSRNARTFNQIFQKWSPDIFVDNHTSNGADYQYTMTLIATQHNKLEAPLGDFLQKTMLPFLYKDMKQKKWEMIPYVDSFDETPDSGIMDFSDLARFSTGYAALWNTIGFMPETHMLKPFKDRVWSTYAFMETVIKFMAENGKAIAKARAAAFELTRTKTEFALNFVMDADKRDSITFKGYTAKTKPSEVSGFPRLWYDKNEPYTKKIPYYNEFKPDLTISKPKAYVIPRSWENVIQRLELNGIQMDRLKAETTFDTETYFIRDFKTRNAYEGHYLHSNVKIEKKMIIRTFQAGDYIIYTNQNANRYIVETLEPQAPDSWFAWNFFDAILMQKEYFSAYVFEDLAADFLKENPKVRQELNEKKKNDSEFAANAAAQLDWVYRQSPWYEPTHQMYPVARILN
jgi:hypothetical protein